MAEFEPWTKARGVAIITAEATREGATLPILHALQEVFGYIHAEAVPLIAETLNLTRASRGAAMRSHLTCASALAWTGTKRLATAR